MSARARSREASLRHQLDTLDSQLADREVYLHLADNLEDSSPDCTTKPLLQPSSNGSESYACSSKTSSSAKTRSPSDTPSPSTATPVTGPATQPTPTRRAKCHLIANCV